MATKFKVIQTAKDTGDKLSKKKDINLLSKLNSSLPVVALDRTKTYQEIIGFGGAFTEAASTTLDKMSSDKRKEIMKAYFDPKNGHGYTLCRTHINSCDFSLGNYAYCEVDGDTKLKNFDISRDKKSLIPMIKEATKLAKGGMILFASPWSPPAWMKTNGQMNHGGQLKKEYWQTWAYYFAKYIKTYAKAGIKIWGVTVQNEPEATQVWDSCRYSGEEERDFVKVLGPMLEKEGLSDVKIMIWDHNKNIIYARAKTILSDPQAAKYVWGVGFHWYSGDQFEELDKVHKEFPFTKLVFTEGCLERGVQLGSWNPGEKYGHDIIGDLNNWTVGWTDWNMILDETGGPNHVNNLCDAPIICDTKTNTVHYQNSFYYLGHFSRYIRPGALRIDSVSTIDQLEITSFLNRDSKIATVVMNRTDAPIDFVIKLDDKSAKVNSPAHSIITLIAE